MNFPPCSVNFKVKASSIGVSSAGIYLLRIVSSCFSVFEDPPKREEKRRFKTLLLETLKITNYVDFVAFFAIDDLDFSSTISSFPNGRFPKIVTRSSLKITSFSRRCSANSVSFFLCFLNSATALLYSRSTIFEISSSICFAVSSL